MASSEAIQPSTPDRSPCSALSRPFSPESVKGLIQRSALLFENRNMLEQEAFDPADVERYAQNMVRLLGGDGDGKLPRKLDLEIPEIGLKGVVHFGGGRSEDMPNSLITIGQASKPNAQGWLGQFHGTESIIMQEDGEASSLELVTVGRLPISESTHYYSVAQMSSQSVEPAAEAKYQIPGYRDIALRVPVNPDVLTPFLKETIAASTNPTKIHKITVFDMHR